MAELYPLCFEPIFRRYLWGGRRLATDLGKTLGSGDDFAESWEVVDHGRDQSVVTNGPLQGQSLHRLLIQYPTQLMGNGFVGDRFPLLFKFLDAQQPLSVQVHPNDEQAGQLVPPDLGKTEAWVVLAAKPGSRIFAGLKPGVDRPTLAREITRGTTELGLHSFEPQPGDCVFIPAGTVHAIGAGLLIAEIQQSSDTTFRLFDWNRTDAEGNHRALHVDEALAVIDFSRGPVQPQQPQPTDRPFVERLVSCSKFVLERVRLDSPIAMDLGGRCHLLTVLQGSLEVFSADVTVQRSLGQTMLVPAELNHVQLAPQGPTVLLDIYLPDGSDAE